MWERHTDAPAVSHGKGEGGGGLGAGGEGGGGGAGGGEGRGGDGGDGGGGLQQVGAQQDKGCSALSPLASNRCGSCTAGEAC